MRKLKLSIFVLLFTMLFMVTSCKKVENEDEGTNNEGGNTPIATYTVTFVDYDDSVLWVEKVEENKAATAPENPTRDGYEFIGWSESFDKVTKDLKVVALYEEIIVEVNKYTVTIDGVSQLLEAGTKVTKPADPEKEGFIFKGWYVGDTEYDFETLVTSDLVIESKWEEIIVSVYYDVTFDQQLDEPSVYVVEVGEGFKVAKPVDPKKEGYNFLGWYLNDELYDFNTPVNSDITLTAKWEEIVYTVTLKANGGSVNPRKITFTDYSTVTLPVATRSNFVFLGWYEGTEKVEAITENRDYSLTAKWEGATFTITYVLNNGEFSGEYPTSYKFGTGVELVSPVREGFDFAGWYKYEDYSGTALSKIGTSMKENITLYAKWERFVTYDLNGGNWNYKTREAMVEDFLTDALAWAGKTSRPDGMVQGAGDTRVGFANVFTGANIQNFFNDATYGPKWKWMKTYIIEATELANSKSQLQSNSEPFWRYSIGAFLFEEYRSGYPITEDFTKDVKANGFWDTLSAGCETVIALPEDGTLKVPVRPYYVFEGWYLNEDFSGEAMSVAPGSCSVYAKWVEEVAVESISITNKVSKLDRFEEYQLTWALTPSNAAIKSVEFISSNEEIASVNEDGLVVALQNGTVTITIRSLSPSGVTDSFSITISSPGHFDVSYESESYVEVGSDIQLNAKYIYRDETTSDVVWSSLNEGIATVSETGVVIGVASGVATIRATSGDNYVDFVVTVLTKEEIEEFAFILESHNSNVFTRYNLGIGAGVPVFYDDIIGGVSDYLFEDYVVHKDHYIADPYCKSNLSEGGVQFITVHYAADMTGSATSGGENLATFNVSKNTSARDASWHYGVGNDGVWACQTEAYGAWHAGSSKAMTWTNTNIEYNPTDPKYATITLESDGYFYLNGKNTGIKNTTTSNRLNQMGLAYKVVSGYYYLGGHYYNSTYNFISSTGGNNNSIGIETSCAKGSDQWLTWQYTAQLVANLLLKYDLPIQRVVGHHFFSGKDCPQQLLENDMEIWWEFMDMVEAELEALTTYKDVKYSLTIESGEGIMTDNGRVVNQPEYSQVVSYTVTSSTGKSITLGSLVPGIYTK